MYGHLYSLCFNLLDSTLSIHLSNDSIMTIPCPKAQMHVKTNSINLYQGYDCYNTSHFTFKRELKDCKDEKVVKKLKLDEGKPKYICIYECNFYDDTFDVNAIHVFVDSNMIMSTDKYVTYCSGGYRDFNIKKGFIFAKVENGPEISYDTFYQGYYDLQINATRSFYQLTENRDLEYNPRYNTDYLGKMRPDITKFKFYNMEDIEISSDDCDVSYDDFFYAIRFKTELYRVVYNGKEYWNYNNDKSNGFPNKIYFTDYNNDMNVCFNDGKIQKVKIKVHFLKLYTTDEFGNRVQIDDNQYRIKKPFKDQRMYKFKEGVKCTEIWHYEYELAWKHKHGDPYPSSFTYDNYMFSISLKFETYFIVSLRGRCNKIWIPMVYYIPKHFKLFQLNENGENLELNEKHYDLTCSHFGSIKYNIKECDECDEIKFDDVTIYKRKQSEQYPYTMTYYTCMPLVTGLCSNLSIRCERKKGIWKTYLREVTDIRKKFRR
ncbi:hypothetical protein TpMuguga_02g02290 [Theileria parva strain Muguga]|uniref:uncharacterized protein n=1 Tax=Theileria parva strain Muguga TaxID=333668 RepID=UPI001C61DD61|nr:uncharacterized protein TpMuguga_02g02290 [Theileria parva strain Muguga]KAF5153610.1 hypothetical protein TpMuguga_02g02290 [Theileria parva strain Muguga]